MFKIYSVCFILVGVVAQLAAYITLLLWNPKESEYTIIYVLAALFGVGAGINVPLVAGLNLLIFLQTIILIIFLLKWIFLIFRVHNGAIVTNPLINFMI